MSRREDDTRQPDPFPGDGDPVATGAKGGGEWPDPDTPPTERAPGSDPERAAAIRRERQDAVGRVSTERVVDEGDER